jgi:hypothetical protein
VRHLRKTLHEAAQPLIGSLNNQAEVAHRPWAFVSALEHWYELLTQGRLGSRRVIHQPRSHRWF